MDLSARFTAKDKELPVMAQNITAILDALLVVFDEVHRLLRFRDVACRRLAFMIGSSGRGSRSRAKQNEGWYLARMVDCGSAGMTPIEPKSSARHPAGGGTSAPEIGLTCEVVKEI